MIGLEIVQIVHHKEKEDIQIKDQGNNCYVTLNY